MVLSKRLNILKNFVSKDLDCADIGADHGLLIISLGNQYFKNKYLGIENKIGPFNNLNNNILKLSKNNNVSCKLSDGLKDVSSNFKSIVLAGMGSELIIRIIKESLNKIINIDEFVIDAHNNVFKILSFMDEIDFSLDVTSVSSYKANTPGGAMRRKAALNVRLAKTENANLKHQTQSESHLKVTLTAAPLPLPKGICTVIDLYTNAIQPLPGDATNNNNNEE